MKFTTDQQKAIDTRNPQILVSAAAGSGKTAVLVQRILSLLKTGVDIDSLLVVTFTEAAAAEMKERIADALASLLEDDPDNENYLRQAARLPASAISTIHAFCLRLAKDNFHLIDLDPGFRIGDNTELKLLQSQVMEGLFEESYSNNPVFGDLVEMFGGGKTRDAGLDNLIRKLVDFINSRPNPEQAALDYSQLNFDAYTDIIVNEINANLKAVQLSINHAYTICRTPDGPIKYIEALQDDEEIINKLQKATSSASLDEMFDAFKKVKHSTIYSYKAKEKETIDEELLEQVKNLRDEQIKAPIKKIKEKLMFASPDKMREDINNLKPIIKALIEITMDYRARYAEEKRARNLVDFNDLEYFAVKILWQDVSLNITSPVALALSQKFQEVLIDEYQDTNEKQELILSAINAKRRFMVGDVKQSVYGFRHAEPKLFMEQLKNKKTESIYLSKNFRSRNEVLDAVNFLFYRLMPGYDDKAALYYGANYEKSDKDCTAELHVAESVQPVSEEARLIAGRIQRLKLEAGYTYNDIVVLTRSRKSGAIPLTEELKQQGVNAVCETTGGFFETPEIKMALSLLRVIDNPRQDIDLLAALRFYGFTADQMLAMRLNTEGDYYDALLACKDEKATKFINNLNIWRKKAIVLPISRLIGVVYNATDILNYFGKMPGGAVRQANLRLLLEKAIQYESTSFSGLFHFVRYVEWLQSNAEDESAAMVSSLASEEDGGVVRVMTIHQSKGLEFPVVFVSQLGRKFNTADERENVILHPKLGLGAMYTDLKLRTRSNTVARLALSLLRKQENLEEELRVLYVAVTRAKEKLILTGVKQQGQSFLNWLVPHVQQEQDVIKLYTYQEVEEDALHTSHLETEEMAKADYSYIEIINKIETQKSAAPSKLAISELKRIYALETSPDSTHAYDGDTITYGAPEFYKQALGQITPMRMGSILHTIVEHIDLHQDNDTDTLKELILKLADKGFITCEEADAVDISRLINFVKSPLADRMRNAKKLYREVPFVIGLTPKEVYGDTDKTNDETDENVILVHGIIDCYFETAEGNIVLVDFKSDARPETLQKRYATQMKVYRRAVEKATGKPVYESLFYSI